MKGLLVKDALNLKSQALMCLAIMVIMLAVVGFSGDSDTYGGVFCTVMVIFIVMLPFTSVAYDEKSSWERFAVSMPISRNTIVLSKYVLTFCVAGMAAVLAAVGVAAFGADPFMAAIQMPVGIALNGIILPIIFRFGVENGRFIVLGVVLLFVACVTLAGVMFEDPLWVFMENILSLSDSLLNLELYVCAGMWLGAAVVTAISIALSLRIYASKDF